MTNCDVFLKTVKAICNTNHTHCTNETVFFTAHHTASQPARAHNDTTTYHIISYHIISYHIISYHIISYHIISYHDVTKSFLQMIRTRLKCRRCRTDSRSKFPSSPTPLTQRLTVSYYYYYRHYYCHYYRYYHYHYHNYNYLHLSLSLSLLLYYLYYHNYYYHYVTLIYFVIMLNCCFRYNFTDTSQLSISTLSSLAFCH